MKKEYIEKIALALKSKGFKNTTCISMALIMTFGLTKGSVEYNKYVKALRKDVTIDYDEIKTELQGYYDKSKQEKVKEEVVTASSYDTELDSKYTNKVKEETSPIYIEAEVTRVEPEEKELTNEEKIAYILEEYELTMEQFNVIAAIILAEAQANNYDGAYDIVNALYNRTWSKRWVGYIEGLMNCDTGRNLYTQATALSQFEVYTNGGYLQFLNNSSDLVGYQAVIDMLYSQESHHNFMSFYADPNEPNGTHFHDELTDEDRIVLENSR